MRLICLLTISVSLAGTAAAAAQPWAAALRDSDYPAAARLLRHAVLTSDLMRGDPAPLRELARLYARGLGVPQDSLTACALATVASTATPNWFVRAHRDTRGYGAAIEEAERFRREHCDVLVEADLKRAHEALGCWAFGLREETLAAGPHLVRIGHGGIKLVDEEDDKRAPLLCLQVVSHVRTTVLEPPPHVKKGTPRHFVEVFGWRTGPRGAEQVSQLTWQVYEVTAAGVRLCVPQDLELRNGVPDPSEPFDVDTTGASPAANRPDPLPPARFGC